VRGKRDRTALGIQTERERDECGEKRDRTALGIQTERERDECGEKRDGTALGIQTERERDECEERETEPHSESATVWRRRTMVVGAAVLGRGILAIGRAVAITIVGRRPMRISPPPIAGRIVAGTRRTIDSRATRIVVGRPTPIIIGRSAIVQRRTPIIVGRSAIVRRRTPIIIAIIVLGVVVGRRTSTIQIPTVLKKILRTWR
jgi:hypothetical protein